MVEACFQGLQGVIWRHPITRRNFHGPCGADQDKQIVHEPISRVQLASEVLASSVVSIGKALSCPTRRLGGGGVVIGIVFGAGRMSQAVGLRVHRLPRVGLKGSMLICG